MNAWALIQIHLVIFAVAAAGTCGVLVLRNAVTQFLLPALRRRTAETGEAQRRLDPAMLTTSAMQYLPRGAEAIQDMLAGAHGLLAPHPANARRS